MTRDVIRISGARQNNLKNLTLDLPLGEFIVVTGVSGSGKSSLAFDTIYSEGQRRYVETFSPYARQFLDRMDKPATDRIEGIPPAIAIDQTNPVRTSRSTVGTMTELNDHLKLLFSRLATLYCSGCGHRVQRDDPESIAARLLARAPDQRCMVVARVDVPKGLDKHEMQSLLERQGYNRFHRLTKKFVEVVVDRVRVAEDRRDRLVEAMENGLKLGRGKIAVHPLDDDRKPGDPWRFSADLHCAECDIHYQEPFSSLFSFNSPMGACTDCRGFGRTMGIDYNLVIPDDSKTLAEGAIRPWQSGKSAECQSDLMQHARRQGVATDIPWRDLPQTDRDWVMQGEPGRGSGRWYGVKDYFNWLESKSYKMHVRVLLSKYRSYDLCGTCHGARLKPEALAWRVGSHEDSDAVLDRAARFRPHGASMPTEAFHGLPGLCIHDVLQLPLSRGRRFFDALHLPHGLDEAAEQVLDGIRTRLRYLCEVGLGYLTLDRQSRTLSGGEVQRINLTTALGTSLVNTLFVLDEPSIGLHPRDMQRIVGVMQRLRDAGNTLLVVEHDPDVMRAADRIIDIGPGPGEHGGEIVFNGSPQEILQAEQSLTGAYLSGRRRVLDGLDGLEGEDGALRFANAPYNTDPGHSAVPDAEAEAGTGTGTDVGCVNRRRNAPKPDPTAKVLTVHNAREHNLRGIDVTLPLERFVVLTGVSGSGKSTLMQDVLYNALCKLKGHPAEPPGAHDAIEGHEAIDDVVLVDQSAIGKTTRSNPASYVGAFDPIRKAFARQPDAAERKYTPGTFSFNSGNGRCPTCGGNGFEHVEMQFLSDVYLRCADCDGKRYRDEVLEIRLAPAPGCELGPRSIAGVLDLTVTEAVAFFADNNEVLQRLEPLQAVGLGYMKLGQPVPTLSGGEAQRLKLAGHLAKAAGRRRRAERLLFLFDEPTTGLHFADVAVLLQAFRRLLDEGHSLLVIEHNIDVMAAADWLIDMGPEGGDQGGSLVCEGTPEQVMAVRESHTGRALEAYAAAMARSEADNGALRFANAPYSTGTDHGTAPAPDAVAVAEAPALYTDHAIAIRNAREHNLKGIDLRIPRDKLTVITGLSGSGKSTVAFDILFNEGQRRYLESLNAYARQFVQPAARPDVDAILGIPPTVAIEQRTSRGGRKSTVGTMTEVQHFLRLLYVKLGTQHCPDCHVPIREQTPEAIHAQIMKDYRGREVELLAPLIVARKGYYTDLAKWAAGKGFAHLRVDGEAQPTDNWPRLDRYKEHDIELPVGRVAAKPGNAERLRQLIREALDYGKQTLKVAADREDAIFSASRACPSCQRSFESLDPRLFSYNSKHGWCPGCYGTGMVIPGFDAEQTGEESSWTEDGEAEPVSCPDCSGHRLNPVALAVQFRDQSIADLTALSVDEAAEWFGALALKGRERAIARDIKPEIDNRLAFLKEVGLGYLALDRAAPTLSGGEAQRIRLAAQLGSNLQGVCYVMDEPTIGLHPRDNRMLLDTLTRLEGKGNTIVVVEHDEDTIRRAEHVVDLGPGAGVMGGRIIAEGTVEDLLANADSVTGRSLKNPLRHPLRQSRRLEPAEHVVRLRRAHANNLKQVDVDLPLGRLVVVSGVSGSGKSTLIRDVLETNLHRLVANRRKPDTAGLQGCVAMEGWEAVERVLEVDQTPIGKTPRSCPATYVGFWDDIRKLYAQTEEARIRGYGPGRFSFNTREGRCPGCEGQGVKRIEMSFLPDVTTPCEVCHGQRFTPETLAVEYKGKSVGEVLNMPIDEAVEFFTAHSKIHHALSLLQDVGLGYLTLGQQSPTLSGGEAQRIKLVTELAKARPDTGRRKPPHTVYVLDEPTVGLHMADVEKLIHVLHRLVDAGHTVVVIEHNLDILAEADWMIDMGPEGGEAGGRVVARGVPETVVETSDSHTAVILREFLADRRWPDDAAAARKS
ncbi:excinuclease ABC subunit A [Natronocella acetinitrilica]|uniref:UvrABC system protein A n=1 Tax=Natronocella acetinitrilica TaxID=414046 RepID=A0AAE3G1E7_9GAMM|nr:excinuclease ABC subunit UvrA [Natronocella acetinitrilica]MCP1674035.1 excinuclease ABC subunit A [Natronocella acetinitrilica]